MQPGKIFPQLVIQLPKVNDSQYPPQRKSFSMLAYYNDHQIENYDWFMRMDDDSVLQWDNLNEFLERDNKILLTLTLLFVTARISFIIIVSLSFIRDNKEYSINKNVK